MLARTRKNRISYSLLVDMEVMCRMREPFGKMLNAAEDARILSSAPWCVPQRNSYMNRRKHKGDCRHQ